MYILQSFCLVFDYVTMMSLCQKSGQDPSPDVINIIPYLCRAGTPCFRIIMIIIIMSQQVHKTLIQFDKIKYTTWLIYVSKCVNLKKLLGETLHQFKHCFQMIFKIFYVRSISLKQLLLYKVSAENPLHRRKYRLKTICILGIIG